MTLEDLIAAGLPVSGLSVGDTTLSQGSQLGPHVERNFSEFTTGERTEMAVTTLTWDSGPTAAQLDQARAILGGAAILAEDERAPAVGEVETAPGGGLTLPDVGDDPLGWFSARDVELAGNGRVSKFLNQGTTGATNDATPISETETQQALIASDVADYANKPVIHLPDANSSNGYTFGNIPEGRTIIVLASYKENGLDATFDTFNSIVSNGTGASLEITGSSGTANLVFAFPTYKNGVLTASRTVLPLRAETIAVTNDASFSAVGTLFRDKDFSERFWKGYAAEILIYQSILTAEQIASIHTALTEYYA